jgi:uncharacterized protein (DUF2249 family)
MSAIDTDCNRVLDARDIEGEPFGHISTALDELGPDETLLLVNSFEPVPLYDVLSDRGFEHETAHVADAEWHVEIWRA